MWYMYLWYPENFILYVAENNVGTRPHPFAFSSLHNVKKEIHLFLHGDHTATHNASNANTT